MLLWNADYHLREARTKHLCCILDKQTHHARTNIEIQRPRLLPATKIHQYSPWLQDCGLQYWYGNSFITFDTEGVWINTLDHFVFMKKDVENYFPFWFSFVLKRLCHNTIIEPSQNQRQQIKTPPGRCSKTLFQMFLQSTGDQQNFTAYWRMPQTMDGILLRKYFLNLDTGKNLIDMTYEVNLIIFRIKNS